MIARDSRGGVRQALAWGLAWALLSNVSARAETYYWDQDGATSTKTGSIDANGLWTTTASNWRAASSTGTLGAYGNLSADQAVFGTSNGGTANTVKLNAVSTDINVNRISFTTTGYTIAPPASGTAKLVLSGVSPTIESTVDAATISAVVSGSSLTKSGNNTVTLSGANTFAGPVTIQNGTLKVTSVNKVSGGSASSSLGVPMTPAEGVIAIGSGTTAATLYRTGASAEVTDRVIDLAGTTGGATIDNSGANQAITLTGDVTASGTGSKALTLFSYSGNITVSGSIFDSAGGATTVRGNGTSLITLSGLSTYTGPTEIISNGGMKVNTIRNLGVPSAMGAPTTVENGTIKLGVTTAAKTLYYNGTGDTTDRVLDLSGTTGGATLDLTGASGTLAFTSDLTASGDGNKSFAVYSGSGYWTLDLAGKILDSATGRTSLSLINFGSASYVRLNSANPYTGTTTIGGWNGGGVYFDSIKNVNSGASTFGNPAPGNGTISMGAGAFPSMLIYTGTGDTTDRALNLASTTGVPTLDQSGAGLLKFTADFTATGAGSKTLTLQGSTAGIGEIAGAITNNSAINKTGLTKTGTGLWTLSGNNTYSGITTLSRGTLRLTGAAALGAGSLRIDPDNNFAAVLESNVDIVRAGGTADGQMRISGVGTASIPGFSAKGADIQVAFGTVGSPTALVWGTAPFQPNGSTLTLNAATADRKLTWLNPINLNDTASAVTRTFRVDAATAELAGAMTKSGGGGLTLVKSGNGTLRIPAAASLPHASGSLAATLTVTAGTLDLTTNVYATTALTTLGGGPTGSSTLLDTDTGSLTLGNNVTYSGNTANDNGATIDGALSLGAATRTFTVNDSTATNYDLTICADMRGSGGLTKAGLGTLRLCGSNTFSGATSVSAGKLTLDYTADANAKISPSAALTLGSAGFAGELEIIGTPAGTVTVNGVTLLGAGQTLTLGGTTSVALGAVSRAADVGPFTIRNSGSGSVTTSAGTINSLLLNANGVVVGAYGLADWMARGSDGTTVVGLSTITGGYTPMGSFVTGANADITSDVTPPSGATFNSIRFNTAGARTLTLSGANTISSGGILVTPNVGANLTKITGGSISQPSTRFNNELVIIQNNTAGALQIDSTIANTLADLRVTKSGPGKLILTATKTANGPINLFEGTVQIGDGATTGTLNYPGGINAYVGSDLRITGNGLTVNQTGAFIPYNGVVTIDVAPSCTLVNSGFNNQNGSWIKTGLGTIDMIGQGHTAGWVKEGTFLSNAGANYTINGGATIGASDPGAPSALVKILGTAQSVLGGIATIHRTGTLDINGIVQAVGSVVFTGGGVVTNGGGYALVKSQVVNYNVISSGGETAHYAADMQGSWARNDNVAMQFAINDDPAIETELVFSGSITNYPGLAGWAIQKNGAGTLYFTGANFWTGNSVVSAGMLKTQRAAALPGYNVNSRWSVSAGATLTVQAGGAGEWTAAEIDGLRGTSPSPFASGAYLGIDTTGGDFTYGSAIGNGVSTLNLRKLGASTLRLTGASTYSGTTSVQGGALLVDGSLGTGGGTVSVSAGATLGGTGSVVRAVSIASGGGLAPGSNGIGTLSTGSFTFTPGATPAERPVWDVELGTASNDRVAVGGNLALPATGTVSLRVKGVGGMRPDGRSFVLMTWTGSDPLGGAAQFVLDRSLTNWTGGEVTVDKLANEIRIAGLKAPPAGTLILLR